MARVLDGAAAGRGGAVAIYGEPGIGKSALLRAAVAGAGLHVRQVACDPLDRLRPAGILHDLVPELAVEAARGSEGAAAVALDRLDAQGAVLVAVDDAHWADDESLRALQQMTRFVARRRLGLLLAVRPHEQPPELVRLVALLSRRGVLTEIVLGALDEDAVHALATAVLGTPPEPTLAARLAAAGGHPRYVAHLVASAQAEGSAAGEAQAHARQRPAPQPPPEVLGELDRLLADTREVLVLAALLGPRFGPRELCIVTGRPMSDLLPPLREALQAAVLGEADSQALEFRHEVVRAALLDDLPAAVRAELHREIAAGLERAGASPAVVAHHLLRAPLTAADLEWVARVGTDVASELPDAAVSLWRRMREVLAAADGRRGYAEAGLARAHLAAGHLREAESAARRALAQGVAPLHRGDLRRSLSSSLLQQGRWEAALAAAEEAAASSVLLPAERAEQEAVASAAALFSGRREHALALLDHAEEAAVRAGAARARRLALAVRGHVARSAGDLAGAEAVLREAVRAPSLPNDSLGHGLPVTSLLALVLHEQDRVAEAEEALRRAEDAAAAWGARGALSATRVVWALLRVDRGRLGEAATALDACWATGEEAVQAVQPLLVAVQALLALHLHGPSESEGWLRRLHPHAPGEPALGSMAWVGLARAGVSREQGDLEARLAALTDGWVGCLERGAGPDLARLGPELAEAAEAAGDLPLAREVAATLTGLSEQNPAAGTLRAAALAAGLLAHGPSEERRPETVLEHWRSSPRRLSSARVAEQVAARLRALGRHAEAREALTAARDGYERAGAAYDIQRLEAEERRWVSRSAPPRPSDSRAGWEALTPTERVVARFVELGESNAQIAERMVLSRRTVESHVSHILAKLHYRSRAELILAAAKGGRIPEDAGDAVSTGRRRRQRHIGPA